MTYAKRVIDAALAEEGYLEKMSNSQLDDKTANAGYANYTKYSRDLVNWIGGPYAQGVAWCDIFIDWLFYCTYGKDEALKLLGGWSAYTPTSAQYFKNMGRYYKTNPKKGDIIFFHNGTIICHTGLVVDVDGKCVYTIEGNTSSGDNSVIANGGGVFKKKYSLGYSKIDGYGRPNYIDYEEKTEPLTAREYDGKLPKIPPNIKKRSKATSKNVKLLQRYLNWFGGYSLVVDGVCGNQTVKAIKDFQKRTGLPVTGSFGPRGLAMAKIIKKVY